MKTLTLQLKPNRFFTQHVAPSTKWLTLLNFNLPLFKLTLLNFTELHLLMDELTGLFIEGVLASAIYNRQPWIG